jgi:hypothetical protein
VCAVRGIKFFVGVLLLPACAAVTMSVWRVGRELTAGSLATNWPAFAFGAGYLLWLVVFALLPKPMRTYVLGHELTHAIWALMMGARVSGLRVRASGGQIKTSKTNWLITLAPYFFPFYAMLFIALFFVAHWIWNLEQHMSVLFFLVGLGWSFHVTFTLMMLMQPGQPDIRSQGWLFSLVVIYCMNLFVMALMAALLSPAVSVAGLGGGLGRDLISAYGWALDKVLAVWHYALAFIHRGRRP